MSDEAKEKAIQNLADINIDYDWWDCTYDDAKAVDLKITSFDLGGRQSIEGDLTMFVHDCIAAIKANHGRATETYKTAIRYAKEAARLARLKNPDDDAEANLEHEFKHDLLEDYRIMLQHEYDYLTTEAAIIETIEANDYDFTEDRKID